MDRIILVLGLSALVFLSPILSWWLRPTLPWYLAGDHIVCGDDVYGGVTRLLDNVTAQQGLSITYVDTTNTDAVKAAITSETKMLWIETPTKVLLQQPLQSVN